MGWHRFNDCTIEKVETSDKYPEGVTLHILSDEIKEKLNEPYRVSFWPTH